MAKRGGFHLRLVTDSPFSTEAAADAVRCASGQRIVTSRKWKSCGRDLHKPQTLCNWPYGVTGRIRFRIPFGVALILLGFRAPPSGLKGREEAPGA